MPKIHRPIHPPTTRPTHPPSPPVAPETLPATAQKTQDGFINSTIRQVYESTPFVMLCTKPDLRMMASKLPVVKEVADAVCPAIVALGQAIKE